MQDANISARNTRNPINHPSSLFFLISLLVLGVNAQEKEPEAKKKFSLMGGISIPVGEFSSTTSSDRGYAQPGLGLNGEFNVEIVRHFGLGILTNFSLNELDHDELQRQFQQSFSGGTVTSGFWFMIDFMGGGSFSMPVTPSLSVYGRVYAGVMLANIPAIKISVPGATAKQSSESVTTFAYGFGGGVDISNHIAAGIRYLTGKPEYEVTLTVTDAYDNSSSSQIGSWKQPSATLQIIMGYLF